MAGNLNRMLQSLSSEELKEFSLLKAKNRKLEEKRERGAAGNGAVSDSNVCTAPFGMVGMIPADV